jgi:hypothetical protein
LDQADGLPPGGVKVDKDDPDIFLKPGPINPASLEIG